MARVPVDLCVPAFLDFPSGSAFLYDIFFTFPCAPALLFHVPMLLCQRAYVWGVGVQLITRALCVYGRIGRAGSTRHRTTTPPRHACAAYEYTGVPAFLYKICVPAFLKYLESGNEKPGTRAHLCFFVFTRFAGSTLFFVFNRLAPVIRICPAHTAFYDDNIYTGNPLDQTRCPAAWRRCWASTTRACSSISHPGDHTGAAGLTGRCSCGQSDGQASRVGVAVASQLDRPHG